LGHERDQVTGVWRRLHDEQLNGVYSPNMIRVVKSRRINLTFSFNTSTPAVDSRKA